MLFRKHQIHKNIVMRLSWNFNEHIISTEPAITYILPENSKRFRKEVIFYAYMKTHKISGNVFFQGKPHSSVIY